MVDLPTSESDATPRRGGETGAARSAMGIIGPAGLGRGRRTQPGNSPPRPRTAGLIGRGTPPRPRTPQTLTDGAHHAASTTSAKPPAQWLVQTKQAWHCMLHRRPETSRPLEHLDRINNQDP